MKSFLFVILSLFAVQSCVAQSQLPKEMPGEVAFSFREGGGMTRSYKKIRIENSVLEFEQRSDNGENLQKWSANVSREDLAKLYQILVENKFDTIKNDERNEIVYDAGSETISISIKKLKSFGVTYGKNSPLSGKNLSRYRAVRKAIDDWSGNIKNGIKNHLDSSNLQPNFFAKPSPPQFIMAS